MKVRIFRVKKETVSIEVEVSSIKEANDKLTSGEFDSEDWDIITDSFEAEDKPEWSIEVE